MLRPRHPMNIGILVGNLRKVIGKTKDTED
jgi:hypothetical protein